MAKGTCEIDGCESPIKARGMCSAHYQAALKKGLPRRDMKASPEQRLWEKVERGPGCWEWTGYTQSGYGCLSIDGTPVRAHRLSWELHNGPIPEGLFVCHHCDNPPCVRPDHLFLGTNSDNIRDAVAKGRFVGWNTRKTHCINGHPFDEQNTRHTVAGRRACITCSNERRRRGPRPSVPKRPCLTCGLRDSRSGGRCSACYKYWRSHGVERPAELIERPRRQPVVACECCAVPVNRKPLAYCTSDTHLGRYGHIQRRQHAYRQRRRIEPQPRAPKEVGEDPNLRRPA